MYIHVIGVCVVFQQLKYISIARDEEISGEKKSDVPLVRKLTDQKYSSSVVSEPLQTVKISHSVLMK